tara:strand:- start:576 stop:764 length:189 start_codon:yes stop_codon:yes gene_type:complete
MSDNDIIFKKGDLVNVLSNYREIIVATGIYMGLDINEMYVKILVDNGKIREFDLTFYYLERL